MIIKDDKDIIKAYLEDHSGLLGGHADKVYIPQNEEEVAEILTSHAKNRTPITISGAGTGVTGARVPFGGDVISLEEMNKITEVKYSVSDPYLIAGAGTRVSEIKKVAEHAGLMYAPDPTETSSFIGGNVSTNASGARGYKYGSTRDYIRRIKVVLVTGEILDIPRNRYIADNNGIIDINQKRKFKIPDYELPFIKNSSGYYNIKNMDLLDLFIGSEGTLGVITEIEVKLQKDIKKVISGIAFFRNEDDSLMFVANTKKQKNYELDVLSLEFYDKNAIEMLRNAYPNMPQFCESAIYFEISADNENEDKITDAWSKELVKCKCHLEDTWFGIGQKEEEYFRKLRHTLPEKVNEIVKRNKMPKLSTDLAVPDNNFNNMFKYIREKLNASGIENLVFGHIGESHLHANMLPKTEEEFSKTRLLYIDLAKKAIQLGGTVSAEHGIGKLKHIYLQEMVGFKGVKDMVNTKLFFDPFKILGLGNIMPVEFLND